MTLLTSFLLYHIFKFNRINIYIFSIKRSFYTRKNGFCCNPSLSISYALSFHFCKSFLCAKTDRFLRMFPFFHLTLWQSFSYFNTRQFHYIPQIPKNLITFIGTISANSFPIVVVVVVICHQIL